MVKPTSVTNSIRALRFAAGEMTQAELADRVGVTRQTIIAIEQGRYSPTLEMAFRIARVFRVPLDEVFQYPDDQEASTMTTNPTTPHQPAPATVSRGAVGLRRCLGAAALGRAHRVGGAPRDRLADARPPRLPAGDCAAVGDAAPAHRRAALGRRSGSQSSATSRTVRTS